jgi:hypothetical protein
VEIVVELDIVPVPEAMVPEVPDADDVVDDVDPAVSEPPEVELKVEPPSFAAHPPPRAHTSPAVERSESVEV